MFELKGDNAFISTISNTTWDANANNFMGANKLEITVEAGPTLITMQSDLIDLQNKIIAMEIEANRKKELIESNPALKDIHEKYEIVYELVKKADEAVGNGGG